MESIWTMAQVGELEFAATSTLLAIKANGQSFLSTEQPDDVSDGEDELEDDEDNEDDHATSRPTPGLATHRHETLIDKFLDRLAEVFSREKSFPQSSKRHDPEHVAATAWIKSDAKSPLTVIVAKNRGFLDDRDMKMLARLEKWLRIVAITSHDRSIETDSIWAGAGGLVEFSRARFWYHISQIRELKQTPTGPASSWGDLAVQITDMKRICYDIEFDSPTQQFSGMVNAAYDRRCMWKGRPVREECRKAVQAINMLGRLRAAYECFKSVALTFDDVRTMEMVPITLRQDVHIDTSRFQKLLRKVCVNMKLPKAVHPSPAANKYKNASRLHVHAEMQILVNLGQKSEWRRRAHTYIGVSKKLCFLCDQILQNFRPLAEEGGRRPSFKARQCHLKVYPLWTLPPCTDLPPLIKLSLVAAVTYALLRIRETLQHELRSQQAIAESTAGVTSIGSLPADLASMRDHYLTSRRPLGPPKNAKESERSYRLGRKLATVQVGLLPADGTDAKLVPITFHAQSESASYERIDGGRTCVPDFSRYWRDAAHQYNRRCWNIPLENQADEDWNGKYCFYWNNDHDLLENRTIKKLLNIEIVDTMRRFWYGDVFLVRYSEGPEIHDFDVYDLPFTISQFQVVLKLVFQDIWDRKTLEAELKEDRFIAERQEKFEADKDIIRQRM
jgi:hypothetical protein